MAVFAISKVLSDRPCHAVVFFISSLSRAGSVIPVTTPAIYIYRYTLHS